MNICPFSKEICTHAKKLHITELNKGEIVELHLCIKCAEEYTNNFLLDKNILSLLNHLQNLIQTKNQIAKITPCPSCGILPEEIIKTGRFGCAQCYTFFHDSIINILARCQAEVQHIGKIPQKRIEKNEDVAEQIKNLKMKMAHAIEIENYEVAGVLKQKIEELNKKV